MMLKGCLFIGVFIAVGCLTKCYHKKCETSQYVYTYCDQEYYECTEWDEDDYWDDPGCEYQGYGSIGGYEYCFSSQKCTTDSYTGQAKCVDDDTDDDWDNWDDEDEYDPAVFYEDGMSTVVTIIIIIVCVTVGIIVMCCICCFCLGKGCFKSRARNQGRAINTQVVTYNHPAGVVQTTTHPPGQGSKQPASQYPPAQYPPAQYPPAAGGYPPAQYPPAQYPPAGGYPPAQYPPAQYPPAGGYPPAQYPPTGGYPPAGPGGEYNPPPPAGRAHHPLPPGDAYPPPPGGCSEPPPSYQSAAQPAENPYVEAFRG